ncbi:hypothetical protein CI109_101872 [Kwoniella shandongensis]|uniref:Uncharacterized protein n=1 Tax=Kwoniella shandongensis TaxID=1734106 RepID=A0A5M6BSM5_9TREE|nr:uncharacterized protein CI109_007050 [Kwoniella shandongensis]KAA5524615.1 hypothetical protein CI109_007050 [Kwoniella shandongensis]
MFALTNLLVIILPFLAMTLAAPVPEGGSAYTGVGGQASGGSVTRITEGGLINLDILNIGSDNAGNGGSANSGSALGGAGTGGCTLGQLLGGGEGATGTGGSAYTGAGGVANGGDVITHTYGGLINLHALNIGSGNAGNGGSANSGSALGGDGGCPF